MPSNFWTAQLSSIVHAQKKGDKYSSRSNLAEMEDEFYDLSSFAVEDSSMEGMSLLDTVKSVKPNILIGKLEIIRLDLLLN